MLDKIKELLGSRRFWMLTLTAVLEILKQELGWSPELLSVIQTWLLGVTAVGTVDSFGERASGTRK